MKRKSYGKKVISVLLVMSCLMSLAACSSPEPEKSGKTSEESEKTSKAVIRDMKDVEDVGSYSKAISYEEITEKFGNIPKPEGSVHLGFAAKAFENEYWSTLKEGVEAEVKDLADAGLDVEIDIRAAQGEADEQGQVALMNDMVNKKYDAILASPISDGNLVQSVEKAHELGIPVVCAVGGFTPSMDIYVGPQNYNGGEKAAEWIADQLGEAGGEVAVIMGMPKEEGARARTAGIEDWFKANAPQITYVGAQNADWDRGRAREVMETLIKKYPDLKAVYANNDTMAMGALEAIKAAEVIGWEDLTFTE